MKRFFSILIILMLFFNSYGQRKDIKYSAYNVISSSIISGIGSGMHKKNGETFIHAFCQGAWKGSIGGILNYSGMKLIQVSSNNNTYAYVWPARLVNSLGNSITINGVNNEKILSSYNMTFWFANLSYDGKFHVKVDPYTVGSAIFLSFKNDMNFNFKNTLATGSLFFDKKEIDKIYNFAETGINNSSMGQNFGNTIFREKMKVQNTVYFNDKTFSRNIEMLDVEISCHELIHSLQYEFYSSLNKLTTDNLCKLLKTRINKYLYINPNFGTLYLMNNYNSNVFENQADFFSKKKLNISTKRY